MSPKVSVIIPVYNVEKYLKECLDSVVNQTLKDIEILCINDGSTDNSLAILKEYEKQDDRIKIIDKKNEGAGAARNLGLKTAIGDYILFFDSDDYMDSTTIEILYNKIISTSADIAICDADKFDSEGNIFNFKMLNNKHIPDKVTFSKLDIPNKIYDISLPASWNKLYNRKFILKNSLTFQEIKSCNDVAFGYLALSVADSITICPQKLVHYRKSSSSISSTRHKNAKNILLAYEFIKMKLSNMELDYLLPALREKIASHIKFELSLCNKKEGKIFIKNAKKILGEDYNILLEGEHIPVVVACNNAYVPAAAVCLYSILEKTNSFVDFILLSSDITSKNYNKLCKSIKKFKRHSIKLVKMDEYNLENLPSIDRFNMDCYSRYFIPEICKKYNKVIYTDADVVFQDDIKKYYEIDLNGYGIAASSGELGTPRSLTDICNYDIRKKKFGINCNHEYFSNGNLIIDCEYWRKNNVTEKLVEITKKFSYGLVTPDLDVMNYYFQNNYKRLDYKYCVCVHRHKFTNGNQEMIKAFNKPFIIHYSGNKKPWETDNVAYFDIFFNLLKKTKFFYDCPITKKYCLNPIFSFCKNGNRTNITIMFIKIKIGKNNIENLFSIKNEGVHKVVTIFGIKLKFKSNTLVLKQQLNHIKQSLSELNDRNKFQNVRITEIQKDMDIIKFRLEHTNNI